MTTITIKTESLLSDMRIKSYRSTERIQNPEERYILRVGEENESEALQCLQEAWQAGKALCRRFLSITSDYTGSDLLNRTKADLTLTLDITARRTSNIGDEFANALHEYLVTGALRRFYAHAGATDLGTVYAGMETAAQTELIRLLYKKSEPVHPDDITT